eukprot:9502552-Pyramimonas_sp.AAC.1
MQEAAAPAFKFLRGAGTSHATTTTATSAARSRPRAPMTRTSARLERGKTKPRDECDSDLDPFRPLDP